MASNFAQGRSNRDYRRAGAMTRLSSSRFIRDDG